MERKLKVAEFATLLGIVPKTVYKMIERNEIITVTEKVNNRQTTLVVVTDEQINELKKNYGKEQVITGNYYENVTENDRSFTDNVTQYSAISNNTQDFTADVIDRIITLNDGYNEQLNTYNDRLQRVNEELIIAKSKMLLLEDKAGREGLYIKEINELKSGNEQLKKWVYGLLTIIIVLLLGLTAYITYNVAVNYHAVPEIENVSQPAANVQETVTNDKKPAEVQSPQQVKVSNQRKR